MKQQSQQIQQSQQSNQQKVNKNIEIITNILFQQNLTTEFNYYSLNIPVNYPVIIFSQNQSFFQSPRLISLPIQSEILFDENNFNNFNNFNNNNSNNNNQILPQQFNEMNSLNYRIWWSKCMNFNQNNVTMNPSLIETIENDYIQYRQLNDNNILSTVENLQNILTLIRLHAINCHQNEITLKHWAYILNLENSRKKRNIIA